MYLVKTPQFIQTLFPNFLWRESTDEKILYLTFDDGPIPEATPWVLSLLAEYNAAGTFFCVGENVRKHPDIYQSIIDAGHAIGNHTYNHISGWNSNNAKYFQNVSQCAELVESNLFRPPYGRLKPKQAQFLRRQYHIVLWDVLSGDFDPNLSNEKCYENVISNIRTGSVVVFHDSLKAIDKLKYVLPKVLHYYQEKGFRFEKITPSKTSMPKVNKSA